MQMYRKIYQAIPVNSILFPAKNMLRTTNGQKVFKRPYLFTLIELLVIVAIIAILASMLLPALGKAKRRVKTLTCLNNLKSIGFTSMNYSNENNDDVVPTFTTEQGASPWLVRLIPYYLKDSEYSLNAGKTGLKLSNNGVKTKVMNTLFCPITQNADFCKSFFTQVHVECRMMFNSYGLNGYNGIEKRTAANAWGNWKKKHFGKVFKIKSPSAKILMSETAYPLANWAWGAQLCESWWTVFNASFRHGTSVSDKQSSYALFSAGTASTCFADGHVESLRFITQNSPEWQELLPLE